MSSTEHSRQTVVANGQSYIAPQKPTVVITIDGCAVEYLTAALEKGCMPNLQALLDGGAFSVDALSEMPSFTNPNNISIVTGVAPAIHGIVGNYYRDPHGVERQLTQPSDLRASTIHAALHAHGIPVLMVTAKDKLRRLLSVGGVPSVSVEKADSLPIAPYGDATAADLVGRPAPHIYDWDASIYAMDIGLAAHRQAGPIGLLYVSFTDYVQHREPPGSALANQFYSAFDDRLGIYLAEGFLVGITADHGMNAKHNHDGSPRLILLEDVLQEAGIKGHAVLPITDPYTAHHGALGSFAWVYVDRTDRDRAIEIIGNAAGVTEAYTGREAAAAYELPSDLIGDIAVSGDRSMVLGRSASFHAASPPPGHLRSHGGRYEQPIPLILSEQPRPEFLGSRAGRPHRNRYIHDLLLNGCTEQQEAPSGIGSVQKPISVAPFGE
ncbi:alkaline phosphatase family protein [Rhodococcus sp. NPDC059968]|uniref:alkaline phosphatase family protein n=1 Tax=Rhodococcus sp. NPDC059968 TaxID=3347017 RepID=UPI00366C54F4